MIRSDSENNINNLQQKWNVKARQVRYAQSMPTILCIERNNPF